MEVNVVIINEAFSHLAINVDLMIANDRIDNEENPHYDLTEMVDATNKEAIYIFISLSNDISSTNEDRQLYIDKDYIYTFLNENMLRIVNPFDINDENYFQDILTTYTSLFDLTYLSIQSFKNLALTLDQPSLIKKFDKYNLKGGATPSFSMAEDEVFETEFIYSDTLLLQVSQILRHDFASTWSKSNFISGIDYFFGTASLPEFPLISDYGY
jgi:hypothetical protein